MAPSTECNSCGAKRWMRDGQGGYVCPRGHSYTHQEEVGDDEAMIGIQTRSIKTPSQKGSSSKKSKESRLLRLAPHIRNLQFQYSLREQVLWIIKNKNYPAKMESVVRDLWILWLKHADNSPFQDQSQSGNVYLSSGLLKPSYSLVFIHIASFFLKTGMFYSDLINWTIKEDFPYFSEYSVRRFWQNNTGGYPSLPAPGEFQRYQTSILNHIYDAGCKLTFTLEQPSLVFRLMKELELPLECYAMYKSISALRGAKICDLEPIWKCLMHIGVCCLFVSRIYHTHSQFRKIPTSPLDVLVPLPADLSRPFLSTMTRIVTQKKKGVDKVAYTLFQRHALTNGISLKRIFEAKHDHFQDTQPPSQHENTKFWPDKVKSYFGNDFHGARSPIYANLLLRTANLFGLDPMNLEKHSRALDMLLNCYSLSFSPFSEDEYVHESCEDSLDD